MENNKHRKVNDMAEQAVHVTEKAKPKRKRHILRKIILFLLVLLILAGAGYYAYTSLKQEYTVSYTGFTASIGSISNAVSFSGSLAVIDSKTYTATKGSTIRTLYVAAGDTVKKDDKLLRLANGDTLTADFDGRVNSVSVAAGDEVTGGAELMQLADFTHLKASFRVDEYDIASVSVGQSCTVTATATEKQFTSTIATINYISASTGSVAYYTATALVNVEAGDGVYPGMQVTVSIPKEAAENVVILKMDALSFDAENSAYVYMYNDAGTLEQVPVEVGVSNGNYVEIKSGLKDGDEVYVEVETAAGQSGLSGLLSGLLGGQQMTPPTGGTMPDFSTMDFSNTDFSGSNGGQSNSGGQMPSGMPGGFGGGQ